MYVTIGPGLSYVFVTLLCLIMLQIIYYNIIQKLNSRVSMLEKSGMSDKDKSKWMTVLVPGFVSSDHSCSDSEDDALVTQPLEW